MLPCSCIAIAALTLSVVPGQAYGPKGLLSPAGLAGFVGHAALSGAPGALWLATEPERVLEAYALTVACAVAVAAYLLLSRITIRRAVPAMPPPIESMAATSSPSQLSAWTLRQTPAPVAQPGAVVPAGRS